MNALLVPALDRSAGQPHPPRELVTRRLPLGECDVPNELNASKCSLTCLGQVSVSGAQAGLGPSSLVGPHHANRGRVVNVLKSLTFGRHFKNSLCSHRTEMSCQCLIAHAFCQRAQPHPSRFNSFFTRKTHFSSRYTPPPSRRSIHGKLQQDQPEPSV